MKVLLVAGGSTASWPALTSEYDVYIGIDRGSLYLREAGFRVVLAIGGFDL